MVINGAAIELEQIKTFKPFKSKTPNILYDGTVIVGTEAACKAEIADVWKRLKGDEGQQMRMAIKRLRDIAAKSWTDGQSMQTLLGFSRYFD